MLKTAAFLHIVINYQRIQKTISFKIKSKRTFKNKGDEKLYSDKNKIPMK